ncbi:MAG: beta-glucosidase [Phycisphaeraceae bacterium]|nr:beta-glucosidase [Phycisphaeraceae bacterium]MCW5763015.1 beta-glucosidase [Phycisphaeraceae bacterium]
MGMPDGFVWGVASASYQVEGAAAEGGRSPSVWDEFSRTPGKVLEGHTGDVACDSYHRIQDDVDLIAGLGATGYRFSIAWPRVMPSGVGTINVEGLSYYDRLIDALLARGVDPWVTLFHWDMPACLFHRGGWLNRDSAAWFGEYTQAVVDRLSDRVTHWFTLNEPQIFLGLGHSEGTHAPGLKLSRKDVLRATHHALLAHGTSTQIIRARAKVPSQIGCAPVGNLKSPATDSPSDIEAARAETFRVPVKGWTFNYTWYCDPMLRGCYPEDGLRLFGADAPDASDADMKTIHQPMDFFGVNIYNSDVVRAGKNGQAEQVTRSPGSPITMFRWPIQPDALYWGPRFLQERYKLPVVITENGLASMDWVHADGKVHDSGRIDFLTRYLHQLGRAIDDGVDVRGYFQWSIMDNFEWAEGYALRFGLVYLDYRTGERLAKDSYHWYRSVIESNGRSLPRSMSPLR